VPPLVSAALVTLLAVGAGLSTLLRLGSVVAMVPVEGGSSIISGRESASRAAVPGTGARIPGAAVRAVPLGTECCHLAGEVLDPLQKCGAVRVWDNARECRPGCGLGDTVRTVDQGVQATLGTDGEDGLCVEGETARQNAAEKVVWHVWG
jgi:hypothetical protein